jgi:hypothetical protein
MTFTNSHRSRRIANVLRDYDTDSTDAGCLIDLLSDARHWCDRHGECFGDLDRIGHDRYLAELREARRSS